jgi:4-hydroxybenzoate polyprenyltransferase
MSLVERLSVWGSLVAFSHSVFALPFALMMIVLVAGERSVTITQIALLIVCVVAARTTAMAFNRYFDAEIDARNPLTMNREIPAGVVSKRSALLLILVSGGAFIAAAAGLGWHCFVFSPLVLCVVFGYSLVKRYSSWCHVVLGVALSLAPGGVWYALTGEWSWKPVPLMVTVTLWVAGFDILYSCQDAEFDRAQRLFSVPSVLGIERAKLLAFTLHIAALGFLVLNGYLFSVGAAYWLGALVFAGLLISQHRAVKVHGIGCVDRVFFTRNGAASILLFVFVLVDAVTRG